MRKLLLMSAMLLVATQAHAATWYVRTDGGTAIQCTGLTDAAYSGSGTGQACAMKDFMYVLGWNGGQARKMAASDTVIIGNPSGAPGQFLMGFDASSVKSGCSSGFPYDCYALSVPGGTVANPTKIYGRGYDSGCTGTKAQLWGNERVRRVLTLGGSNIELKCLDITDHSACIFSGPIDGNVDGQPVHCKRDSPDVYPYGPWGEVGILASDDIGGILLDHVDVHGLAKTGIWASRQGSWSITDSHIVANGFVGWDGDGSNADDGYTGSNTFTRSSMLYSGCGERYPLQSSTWTSTSNVHHCWSQDQGGYGDGFGFGDGAVGSWTFTDSDVSHNTSDGFDSLHSNGTGSIIFERTRVEGNAGNQIKTNAGNVTIENSKIIGDCAWFYQQAWTSTKSNTGTTVAFNNCRAAGNTFEVVGGAGRTFKLFNSSVYSNGDVIVDWQGNSCDANSSVTVANSIILGGIEFLDGADKPAYFYNGGGTSGCNTTPMGITYSQINGVKSNVQPAGTGNVYTEPKWTNSPVSDQFHGQELDIHLSSLSGARDTASEAVAVLNSSDYNNWARGASWDMGAYEYDTQVATGSTCDATHCSLCLSSPTCSSVNCTWNGSSCATSVCDSTHCNLCSTSGACTAVSCFWNTNVCSFTPACDASHCSLCSDQNTCQNTGCFWYNNTCNTTAAPPSCDINHCSLCANQSTCTTASCYWYNSSCNATAQPACSHSNCTLCSTQTTCEASSCYWFNSGCTSTAQGTKVLLNCTIYNGTL